MKQYGQTEIVVPAVERIVVACECGDILPIAGLEGMFFYHRGMKSLFLYIGQWHKIPFGDGNLINAMMSLTSVQEFDTDTDLNPDIGGTYLISKDDATVRLPPVTIALGVSYTIKSISGKFTLIGASASEPIDGAYTQTVGMYESITVRSARSGWYIVNWYIPKSI